VVDMERDDVIKVLLLILVGIMIILILMDSG
jgi:hypothetical protein